MEPLARCPCLYAEVNVGQRPPARCRPGPASCLASWACRLPQHARADMTIEDYFGLREDRRQPPLKPSENGIDRYPRYVLRFGTTIVINSSRVLLQV